jgi:hypothetical protein
MDIHVDALLLQDPTIPPAVPAAFTPLDRKRTLDQSLLNPTKGNRNVYIRGLHPDVDDTTLVSYASQFGRVESSKAINDGSKGACKGYIFSTSSFWLLESLTYVCSFGLQDISMFGTLSFVSVAFISLVMKLALQG